MPEGVAVEQELAARASASDEVKQRTNIVPDASPMGFGFHPSLMSPRRPP